MVRMPMRASVIVICMANKPRVQGVSEECDRVEWTPTHEVSFIDFNFQIRKSFKDEMHALDEITKDELPVHLNLCRCETGTIYHAHLLNPVSILRYQQTNEPHFDDSAFTRIAF